jgi:hypothetical protein
MFTALFRIFKSEPETEIDLTAANKALHERMIHVLRHPHLAPRTVPRETYSTPLLKNRVLRRATIII